MSRTAHRPGLDGRSGGQGGDEQRPEDSAPRLAARLHAAGLWPLPLRPGQKAPGLGSGWPDVGRDDALGRVRDGHGVGLHLVGLWQLDVDDPAIRDEVLTVCVGAVPDLLTRATVRWTPGRGGMHVLVRVAQDAPRAHLPGIELRGGRGQQAAVWLGAEAEYEDVDGVALDQLGAAQPLSPDEVDAIVRGLTAAFGGVLPPPPTNGTAAPPSATRAPSPEDAQRIADALSTIPAACGYGEWLDVGFSLHDAWAGGAEGLELYRAWSAKADGQVTPSGKPAYKPGEPEAKWNTFGEKRNPIGLGTLFRIADRYRQLRARGTMPAPAGQAAPPIGSAVAAPARMPEIPEHLLPALLVEHAHAVACSRRCDPTLALLADLAACSAALGRGVELALGVDADTARSLPYGHADSLAQNASVLLVAASGGGKSSALGAAFAPLVEYDQEARRAAQEQRDQYKGDMVRHNAAMRAWDKAGADKDKRPPQPLKPRRVAGVVEKATAEGLAAMVADNPRGLALVADEYGNLLRGQAPDAQQAWLMVTKAGLSSSSFRRDTLGDSRAGREQSTCFVRSHLVVAAATHEAVLRARLLGSDKDPELRVGGLLGRLFCYSSTWAPTDTGEHRAPVSDVLRARWAELLDRLRAVRKCDFTASAHASWRPSYAALTDRAREVLDDFDRRGDFETIGDEVAEPARGFVVRSYARAAGLSLLLAAIHERCPDPRLGEPGHVLHLDGEPGCAPAVPAWAAQLAVELVEWQNACAVAFLGKPEGDEQGARTPLDGEERVAAVLDFVRAWEPQEPGERLTARTAERECWAARRRRGEKRADSPLGVLERRGLLRLGRAGRSIVVELTDQGRGQP